MNLQRLLRHLFYPGFLRRRVFSPQALLDIEQAIQASEARHQGEIRFAVEAALDISDLLQGQSPRERAIELFSDLRIWDTEDNSGVLIYLLLADHDVEIVADRGIHRHVGEAGWQAICRTMEQAFRQERFAEGVLEGIQAITALLIEYCPARPGKADELPNRPLIL